jgi:predicted porin
MNKTLIALAVGAAFVAPSAFADVTLSGSINMGIAWVKSSDGTAVPKTNSVEAATGAKSLSNSQLTSNYSNITISSMEDLGGGLKLDFAYQMNPNLTNNQAITNRNSHIGLVSDSWGGVWYGTNENLYERYYYTIDPLDGAAGIGGNLQMLGTPGYGVVFDDNGAGPPAGAGFYRRTAQTIWYDSPSWGGFTFGAYTTTNRYKTAAGFDPKIWGIGGKYVGPTLPIQAWIAYENHKDLNGLGVITGSAAPALTITAGVPAVTAGSGNDAPTGSKDHGLQVGVGYTLGDIFLFLNYEQLKYEANGLDALNVLGAANIREYKRNAFSLGVKWNVATGYFGAQYIQAQDGKCELVSGAACSASDSGARMLGLGYYHTMSKQTQAYVMGTIVRNKDLASYALAGASTNSTAPGADHTAITVGLKHSF